ncbi:MAG: imidazole glycerol phosphate synthase subunit HisH [Candidatus Promineifilaceae bacterium]|jgi:glutamine amidotransferase
MIDYGASNIRSAQKAFEAVGASVELTADPDIVLGARKLVLPGVGAFGAGIHALRERDLDSAVKTAVANGIPLLGICLGMQFLFEESDEMGQHEGLGLIPGHVTRFNFVGEENLDGSYKVPHMGWNQIEYDHAHPLLKDVPSGSHTYFVHSYYCVPTHKEDIVAITQYGLQFTSIVSRDNVHGIQFHPEKSQKRGLQLIKNYLEMN